MKIVLSEKKYQIFYDKLNRCKLISIAYCPHFDSDLHPNLQNTRCKASSIHYKWVASIGRSQPGSGWSRNIRIWRKKTSVLLDIISFYSSLDLLSFSLCNKLFEKEISWLTHNWRFDLFVVFLPVMDKL